MTRLFFILIPFLFWQCARQSAPAGGPQDKEPPQLVSSTPLPGQKNYKGKTIELTFDEQVKLKDPQEEIIITPSVGAKTKFAAKKTKVIITPENAWKDSTTYSIAFRAGIQDINESNPADDLHLAFSTGSVIDSLNINGSVTELFKDKLPEKITVALYQSDTFDIFKHRPTYFGKTDKEGRFSIQNLKAGKYFIYAFDDKNKNFRADSKSERFGFSARQILLSKSIDSIQLDLIKVDTRPIKLTSVRNTNTISMIRFNKPLSKVSLKSEFPRFIHTYGDNQSEVVVYKDFDKRDSLLIRVSVEDSVQQKLDTAVYVKYTDSKKIEEKFKISDWQLTYNAETKQLNARATINKLLLSANYDSMYIQIDTVNFQLIKPEELRFDTLTKIIRISTALKIQDKENLPNPVFLFGKGAFVSIDKDSTKSTDVKINLPKSKDTGSLAIEVNTKEKHFEIQLQDVSGKLIQSIRNQSRYIFKFLQPAEYRIAIVVDANNNGQWDPGTFFKRKEPEKVILYRNAENKFSFPIRANWEVGPLVISF